MKYVRVPKELRSTDVRAEETCFSPGRYVRFLPPAQSRRSHFVSLDQIVIVRDEPVTPNRADTYRYAEIGDIDVATGGVSFRVLRGFELPTARPARAEHGDVLISTVRTYRKGIGRVTDDTRNLVTTNAVLNFCAIKAGAPTVTLAYVFAFLRSDFFVEQVWSLLNRGVYPRMDVGALDKIVLPVADDEDVCKYVAALAVAVTEKERTVRARFDEMLTQIDDELSANDTGEALPYDYPTVSQLRATSRLDTGLYCSGFRAFQERVKRYRGGATTLGALGVRSRRGPNLAISVIGKSLYSYLPKPGWYELIRPVNITEYGTVSVREWLGSSKNLPTVSRGDIIFGCEATWRSVVMIDPPPRCTTNFHGTILYWPGAPIRDVIWLHAILAYLKKRGVLKYIAVGGQGGHLSPEYFEYIPVPDFPSDVRDSVARFYHKPAAPPARKLTLENFVEWHREWNEGIGIWELDREMKALQQTLSAVQEQIIDGKTVALPF